LEPDWPVWKEHIESQQIALEKFRRSYQVNRRRYLAQSVLNMDFDARSFDMAISVNCITQYLDLNADLLREATIKAVDVVKPGSRVVYFPFGDGFAPIGDPRAYFFEHRLRRQNQRQLLGFLDNQDNLTYQVKPVIGSIHKKLVIVKS